MFQGDSANTPFSRAPPPPFFSLLAECRLQTGRAESALWRGSPRPPWRTGGGWSAATSSELRGPPVRPPPRQLAGPREGWPKGQRPLSPTVCRHLMWYSLFLEAEVAVSTATPPQGPGTLGRALAGAPRLFPWENASPPAPHSQTHPGGRLRGPGAANLLFFQKIPSQLPQPETPL